MMAGGLKKLQVVQTLNFCKQMENSTLIPQALDSAMGSSCESSSPDPLPLNTMNFGVGFLMTEGKHIVKRKAES